MRRKNYTEKSNLEISFWGGGRGWICFTACVRAGMGRFDNYAKLIACSSHFCKCNLLGCLLSLAVSSSVKRDLGGVNCCCRLETVHLQTAMFGEREDHHFFRWSDGRWKCFINLWLVELRQGIEEVLYLKHENHWRVKGFFFLDNDEI